MIHSDFSLCLPHLSLTVLVRFRLNWPSFCSRSCPQSHRYSCPSSCFCVLASLVSTCPCHFADRGFSSAFHWSAIASACRSSDDACAMGCRDRVCPWASGCVWRGCVSGSGSRTAAPRTSCGATACSCRAAASGCASRSGGRDGSGTCRHARMSGASGVWKTPSLQLSDAPRRIRFSIGEREKVAIKGAKCKYK